MTRLYLKLAAQRAGMLSRPEEMNRKLAAEGIRRAEARCEAAKARATLRAAEVNRIMRGRP